MAIKTLEKIRHNGEEIPSGESISLNEQEEKRLVLLNSAEYVKETKELDDFVEEIEVDPEEYEELSEGLKGSFKAEELVKEAKKHNVVIESQRKDDVIHAIITQGKAEDILKEEE